MIPTTTDSFPKTQGGRIPFDSAVWQMQDSGDFINTKTGELRDEDGFLSEADNPGSEALSDDWDASQETGGFEGASGDTFEESSQVKPARREASEDDQAAYRPSKLGTKRRK